MKNVERKYNHGVNAGSLELHMGESVCIHGSIYKIRRMSGFAFVLLRTRERVVQCIYSPEFSQFELESLREEMCVTVQARVVAEERSRTGYELHLLDARILSRPFAAVPVVINQKKVEASIESVLDYRPITLRNERERAVFRIQAGLCQGFRSFLETQGFTEIHTPKIVAAGAEGGSQYI